MRSAKDFCIFLLTTLLLLHGVWTLAEIYVEAGSGIIRITQLLVVQNSLTQAEINNEAKSGKIRIAELLTVSDKIRIATLLIVHGNLPLAEDCDEAREWYDEGLLLSDDSDQEIYYYQRAVALCPGFVAAHNRLAEVYKNQEQYALSIERFELARIHALSSNYFASRSGSRALFLESVISLGEIYRIQGNYERAAEEFSKALQIDPNSLAAQNNLQYIYKRMHRYDDVLLPMDNLLVNGIFTRIPGMTLPKNTFTFDVQYKFWNQTAILTQDMFDDERILLALNPSERESSVKVGIVSMRYGLTNDLTIGLIPKYFSRSLKIQLDAFNVLAEPTEQAFGDTELLLKYRIWGVRNRHISIYSSFTLPTGKTIVVTGDEPLRRLGQDEDRNPIIREFELRRYVPFGSESYDITPGLAFTLGLDPIILNSNMQYRFTDGEQVGDEFKFNLGGIYRFNHFVNATLDMNYRWRGDVRRKQQFITFALRPDFIGRDDSIPAGALIFDSYYTEFGGHTLFLSPGLQFTVAQDIRLEFGMMIPVVKQSTGWTEDTIYHFGVTFMTF